MNEATIARKIEQVEQITDKIKQAGSVVFVDYLGLTVEEITDLRVKLHKEDCELKVIKNNILKRAAEKAGYSDLTSTLVGPNAAAFSKDEVAASKVLFDFVKEHKKLEVKIGVVDGKITSANELQTLASLPNKDGMISMLLSVILAPVRNLAYALSQVAEKE
ncbi:MAG TPA: 50S ribosomal protein L10 [Acholeplasmataceae bacterium]|nr:50S ribosomal protein L10 [Acholeplasmataceae bacterium]